MTMIPQSISYAAIADLKPEYGLNSTFLGCLLYAVFGTIKEVSVGPAAVLSLLVLEYSFNKSPRFAILHSFVTGCVQLLMAMFKLGFIVNYISTPVSSGFVTAVAITIIGSQLKGLFGLDFKSRSFFETFRKSTEHLPRFSDLVMGIVCIILLLLMKGLGMLNIKKKTKMQSFLKTLCWLISISRNTIIVVFGIFVSIFFKKNRNEIPFILSGGSVTGLPPIRLPITPIVDGNHTYSIIEAVQELGAGPILIPAMSLLMNVAIARLYAQGKALDATQELFALGLCNMLGSFVGSLPVSGAITRSAIGSASHIRTPIAGVFTGGLTLLSLSYLSRFFHLIPRTTLAAMLICAVVHLVDWRMAIILWRSDRKDLVMFLATILSCLFFGVGNGVLVTIAASLLQLVYLWARPEITIKACKTVRGNQYAEITVNSGLSFPGMESIREIALQDEYSSQPLVMNCEHFRGLDFTVIKDLYLLLNERDQKMILINCCASIIEKWNKTNLNARKKSQSLPELAASNIPVDDGLIFAAVDSDRLEAYLFGNNLDTVTVKRESNSTIKEKDETEVIPLMADQRQLTE